MPNRVQWDVRFSVGNEALDEEHKYFLTQCNALADCLDEASDEGNRKFDQLFAELMVRAREHFASEEALLVNCSYPNLEDHRSEQEEYEFLAAEIVTTENFDKDELQVFLALWWAGHIMGAARNYSAYF